jgi:4-hydroxy-2-oxoglutarate aldolase
VKGDNVRSATRARRLTSRDLRGVLLPFTTPFDADGALDLEGLRDNIARWNKTGIAGYVALGSTGERVHLDDAEVSQVVETARAVVPSDLVFIVGVGQQSTRATITEARRAAQVGADALLVITPHFYKGAMTQSALVAHYESVADAASVPVVIYSIPQNTGIMLAPETVARLSRHENIVGLKESSGDVVAFVEMLRVVDEDFSMMTGHASALHAALASGARGAILAVACCVPRFAVALARAVEENDHERARRMQAKLIPLARAVTTRFGVGGLKVALDAAGYRGGMVRAPLSMPDDDARTEIVRLLAEFGDEEGWADAREHDTESQPNTMGVNAGGAGRLKGAAS